MQTKRSEETIKLSIVGHSNTGKTSLIRTLLRSSQFGKIENAAGTTRHVESAIITTDDNEKVITFFDTPGLEDASAFTEHIPINNGDYRHRPSRHVLENLCKQFENSVEFNQEVKVVKQSLKSDILFYIVDVRENFLEKYEDEIQLLKCACIPIIPVLNFLHHQPNNLDSWRQGLSSLGLHTAIEFDTVVFNFEAEKRLYQKIQGVLERKYDVIQQLIACKEKRWQQQIHASYETAAQYMINLCTYRTLSIPSDHSHRNNNDDDAQPLKTYMCEAEKRVFKDITKLFHFDESLLHQKEIIADQQRWTLNIFDTAALKQFGLNAGATAAKGAAIGLGIDLAVGGLSLGAAAASGAIIGATWSSLQRYGKDALSKLRGDTWIRINEITLDLALLRVKSALTALTTTGHAQPQQATTDDTQGQTASNKQDTRLITNSDDWKAIQSQCQSNPHWHGSTHTLNSEEAYKKIVEKMHLLLKS